MDEQDFIVLSKLEPIERLRWLFDKINALEQRQLVARFIKPTPLDLKSYAVSIGFDNFEVETFFNHYESVNWRVGKNKMSDWKAAVRKSKTWDCHKKPIIVSTIEVKANETKEYTVLCNGCGYNGKITISKYNRVVDSICPKCKEPFLEEVI